MEVCIEKWGNVIVHLSLRLTVEKSLRLSLVTSCFSLSSSTPHIVLTELTDQSNEWSSKALLIHS